MSAEPVKAAVVLNLFEVKGQLLIKSNIFI